MVKDEALLRLRPCRRGRAAQKEGGYARSLQITLVGLCEALCEEPFDSAQGERKEREKRGIHVDTRDHLSLFSVRVELVETIFSTLAINRT